MQKVENHSLNVYSIRKWKLTKNALIIIIMNLHIPSVMNHGAFIIHGGKKCVVVYARSFFLDYYYFSEFLIYSRK